MKPIEIRDQNTIFDLLKTLYRSHNGTGLNSDNWLHITKIIEDLNERYNHLILKPQPENKLPVLIQPTRFIFDTLIKANDSIHTRAASAAGQFDFVFQLIKAPYIKGAGKMIKGIIDAALKPHGLCLGLDISEYEEYLNAFTTEALLFKEDEKTSSFYFIPAGSERSMHFCFDPDHEIKAKFSYQIWRAEFMGIHAASTSLNELHDIVAEKLYETWISKPDSLKRAPMQWIEEYDIDLTNSFKNPHYTVWPKWKDNPNRTRPEELYSDRSRYTTTIIDE